MQAKQKVMLIILDGIGDDPKTHGNACVLANLNPLSSY